MTKKVSVCGCGAVTSLYYGPALEILRREGVAQLHAAFDPSPHSCEAIASRHPGAIALTGEAGFARLLDEKADLMIIASPPGFHAGQAIAALERGFTVMVEKPIAAAVADAKGMLDAAERTGGSLFVNMVRRQFPAAIIIRDLIRLGLLGEIVGFEVFEGGPFRWPVSSPEYFGTGPASGLGVVADTGVHVLDLLIWWLGDLDLLDAQTDAMGGLDCNALLTLASPTARGTVRLSRDWQRPNRYDVRGTISSVQWDPDNLDGVTIGFGGNHYRLGDQSGTPMTYPLAFARQIRQALAGDVSHGNLSLASASIRPLALIEEVGALRRMMSMPWLGPEEWTRAVELSAS